MKQTEPTTLKPETPSENQVEPTPINPCQGYQVDPELHLCNVCEYHKWRNESKPWLKHKNKLLSMCSSECEVCEKLFSLKAETRNEVEETEKVCCCSEKDKKCPASSGLNW